MKKLIAFLAFGCAMTLAVNAQSSNANSLENRARAAAQQCVDGGWSLSGGDVEVILSAQGRCIGGGTANTFIVQITYTCPPPLLPVCLVPAPTPVAEVGFDCDNKLVFVNCL